MSSGERYSLISYCCTSLSQSGQCIPRLFICLSKQADLKQCRWTWWKQPVDWMNTISPTSLMSSLHSPHANFSTLGAIDCFFIYSHNFSCSSSISLGTISIGTASCCELIFISSRYSIISLSYESAGSLSMTIWSICFWGWCEKVSVTSEMNAWSSATTLLMKSGLFCDIWFRVVPSAEYRLP